MRTTMHNGRAKGGRAYSSKHNDRKFDVEQADNIDVERMKNNQYINYYNDPNMTFEQVELKFYEENFGHQLEKTNERYVANGHPERCKSMEQWKAIRQNAPEESVLQIGKKEESVSRAELIAVYNDYNKWLNQWNREHGRPFTVLNTALHCDEAVNHIQSRRVWHYRDEEGRLRTGQEKALKAAGVELPDPKKDPGRRNNRKMTFDKMCREKWLDICHEHGLDIEREPVPDGKHNMEKEDMIRHKYETMIKEASEAEVRRDSALEEVEDLESELLEAIKMRNETVDSHNELIDKINKLVPEYNDMQDELDGFRVIKAKDVDLSSADAVKKKPIMGDEYYQVKAADWEKALLLSRAYGSMEHRAEQAEKKAAFYEKENSRKDARITELVQNDYSLKQENKALRSTEQEYIVFIKILREDEQKRKEIEEALKRRYAWIVTHTKEGEPIPATVLLLDLIYQKITGNDSCILDLEGMEKIKERQQQLEKMAKRSKSRGYERS